MTAAGMDSTQRFELLRWPRVKKWTIWVWIICLGWLGVRLVRQPWGWQETGWLVIWLGIGLENLWTIRQPPKFLELSAEAMRGPVGWKGRVEIPREHVVEISPTTEGLIIAWNRNGVPWYTEVPESWFSTETWQQVRQALLSWGLQSPRTVHALNQPHAPGP